MQKGQPLYCILHVETTSSSSFVNCMQGLRKTIREKSRIALVVKAPAVAKVLLETLNA